MENDQDQQKDGCEAVLCTSPASSSLPNQASRLQIRRFPRLSFGRVGMCRRCRLSFPFPPLLFGLFEAIALCIRRRRLRGCFPFERDHCRAPDKEFSRIRWLSPQRSTWPAPKAQYLGTDVHNSFSWRRTDTCAGIPRLRRWSLGDNLRACHPAPVHTSGEWRRRHRRRSREARLQDRERTVSSRHAAQSHSHVRMTANLLSRIRLSMATETCSTVWHTSWRSKS